MPHDDRYISVGRCIECRLSNIDCSVLRSAPDLTSKISDAVDIYIYMTDVRVGQGGRIENRLTKTFPQFLSIGDCRGLFGTDERYKMNEEFYRRGFLKLVANASSGHLQ